jgi:hypothetical protein
MHQEVNVATGTASSPPPITRQFRLPLLFGSHEGLGIREVDVRLELDPLSLTVTSLHLQFHKRSS